jgi:hypothetical protein
VERGRSFNASAKRAGDMGVTSEDIFGFWLEKCVLLELQ